MVRFPSQVLPEHMQRRQSSMNDGGAVTVMKIPDLLLLVLRKLD